MSLCTKRRRVDYDEASLDKSSSAKMLEMLQEMYSSLLEEPKYSDLTIKCNESSFRVNRCILALHTNFFDKTDASPVDNLNTIEIQGHSAITVWRVLSWCYTGYYPSPDEHDEGFSPLCRDENDVEDWEVHMKVSYVADYLGIDDLKPIAALRFYRHWLTPPRTKWSEEKLLKFLKSVTDVFKNTVSDDMMRFHVAALLFERHKELKAIPEYAKVLDEVDGLASALLLKYF